MDFSSNIKSLRLRRNLSQEKLAEQVGVSVVAVQCWERGARKPSFDALASLCAALSVSADRLLGLSGGNIIELPNTRQETALLKGYRQLDRYGKRVVDAVCREELRRAMDLDRYLRPEDEKPPEIRMLRRYFLPAAAGYSFPIDGEDYEMIEAGDDVPAEADYAVNIQGNSMAPYILDGTTVFVQKTNELSVGDVGIFCVEGAMYCKIYYRDADGNVTLVSANPALQKRNVYIPADSDQDVVCMGKVLLGLRVELPDNFTPSRT